MKLPEGSGPRRHPRVPLSHSSTCTPAGPTASFGRSSHPGPLSSGPMSSSEHEDVKRTIRALVGVIQSASQGGSPVDHNQVDHVRKVVRLLSLSHEQVSHMPLPLNSRTHRISFCVHRLPQVDSTQCLSAEALLPCKPTHTHACSVFLRRRSLTCVSLFRVRVHAD